MSPPPTTVKLIGVFAEIFCAAPAVPYNSTEVSMSPYRLTDSLQYQCDQYWKLATGDLHRVCQDDGSFDGVAPVCKRMYM